MRKQHRWIRQQLICCFIHTYTQVHQFPPTVREIGAWVGCPGMRSLQRALADLERQQYLTRQAHAQRSIDLTAKGIALAERWQLLVPVARVNAQTRQALAHIRKREVGTNPAWPNVFPNCMPSFFNVLDE